MNVKVCDDGIVIKEQLTVKIEVTIMVPGTSNESMLSSVEHVVLTPGDRAYFEYPRDGIRVTLS